MSDIFLDHADRRQHQRLAIHHHSRLHLMLDGAEPGDETIGGVTLTDISRDGLMAADAGQLVPGAKIVLEVPLVGWREAEVIWIAANRAGCRFMVPLNIEELRLAAASSERLANEFPNLATQIAGTISPQPGAATTEPPAEPSSWRWPLLGLASLAVTSFAAVSWLLA